MKVGTLSLSRSEAVPKVIRRRRIFLFVAGAAALVSVGGLLGSLLVKSPAQLAADQAPPSPSVLTAPVVRQVLTRSIVVRGTVVAGSTVDVTPTAAQGATALVVTRAVKRAGDTVRAGDVLVEVSGRPVIALPGSVPAYRDLKPGDTGDDIAELQAALGKLGYSGAGDDGTFGPGTKAAVRALYEHLGYSVPTTGGGDGATDQAALDAAAQAVTAAGRTVTADEHTVARARTTLDNARHASPVVAGAVAAAQDALDTANQDLTYARQDLATAQQARSRLVATTGVEMPLNEFVFLPSFPAHLSALRGGVGSAVTAPLVTLDIGAFVVRSVLQEGEQSLVKQNMAVQLVAEQLNAEATGTVTQVGAYSAGTQSQNQGSDQGQGQGQGQAQDQAQTQQEAGYPIVTTPAKPLASSWLGQDVRVTVAAASTSGPVLVVPVAAVSTGQDGTTAVTVLRAGNTRVRTPVTAGLDANGLVQVTPAAGATLAAGDLVITG